MHSFRFACMIPPMHSSPCLARPTSLQAAALHLQHPTVSRLVLSGLVYSTWFHHSKVAPPGWLQHLKERAWRSAWSLNPTAAAATTAHLQVFHKFQIRLGDFETPAVSKASSGKRPASEKGTRRRKEKKKSKTRTMKRGNRRKKLFESARAFCPC